MRPEGTSPDGGGVWGQDQMRGEQAGQREADHAGWSQADVGPWQDKS